MSAKQADKQTKCPLQAMTDCDVRCKWFCESDDAGGGLCSMTVMAMGFAGISTILSAMTVIHVQGGNVGGTGGGGPKLPMDN